MARSKITDLAAAASGIEVDMFIATKPVLAQAWKDWCEWRTDLALTNSSSPWTPVAARIAMRKIAAAAQTMPETVIAQAIETAITKCWRDFYLDGVSPSAGGGFASVC